MKVMTLIEKNLSKKELSQMKLLTKANIAWKLLHIFESHVGAENSISRAKLFRKVFGRAEEISLVDEMRWDFIRGAMLLCRQKTKCFIGSCNENGVWYYFVIKDEHDAQYYINILEKAKKRMTYMQKKARKSVQEKWHKIDWIQEAKKQDQITYQ